MHSGLEPRDISEDTIDHLHHLTSAVSSIETGAFLKRVTVPSSSTGGVS
jgi:hypothetical protein